MSEKGPQESLGRLFVKELVRATSWGTVFLFGAAIFLVGAKQNIKKAIDFSFKRAVGEVHNLVSDPLFKQDFKEAIDFWHVCKDRKIEPVGKSNSKL